MFYYVVYIGLRINDLTNSQLQTYFFHKLDYGGLGTEAFRRSVSINSLKVH